MLCYTISLNPLAGTFFVELQMDAQNELLLRFPAWLPGSYMIRDMASEIESLEVICGSTKIQTRKIDKSTWRISLGTQSRRICVRYEVFAQDPSVRRAYLDSQRAFLTFSSLCFCPIGYENEEIEINIKKPQKVSDWKVATELSSIKTDKRGFGRYRCSGYDELIDTPVEIGSWKALSFDAYGVRHRIVLSGKVPPFDQKRLIHDVRQCVKSVISFFEPEKHRAPFESYTFFLNLSENLYGGLEHRTSTALAASFYDLPLADEKTVSREYGKLLELFTHEYFHAWWVKRVKPAAFIPYDLTQEVYTELLWVFEGFTSYYDALLTARSGAIGVTAYLKSLEDVLNRHMAGTAKNRQNLAESSFDAWIKYYKVRTNRSRSVTSYYDKGALIALALDALIQKKTDGQRSLDDVLRYAWEQFKQAGAHYAGLPEQTVSKLILDATGVDASAEICRWVYACEEPDYKAVFKTFGVAFKEKIPDIECQVLQAKLSGRDDLSVAQLDEGGAAEKAGLCVGDELIAIDGIRARKQNIEKLLKRYAAQKVIRIHSFRKGLLNEHKLVPQQTIPMRYELCVQKNELVAKWLSV